ncbi:hypothetical protein AVEN_219575-1 [Araneus ventricosus]|uniref:Ionotropic glutamate receptor C-terminal domain-containing protein n=1 Tax=Araneus ventricosus TaxID=182803 RepID=A0A4Y2MVU6_ARAVE|nr:hypothetical protein AVEN_219575-1 [Araneus ventricosus]
MIGSSNLACQISPECARARTLLLNITRIDPGFCCISPVLRRNEGYFWTNFCFFLTVTDEDTPSTLLQTPMLHMQEATLIYQVLPFPGKRGITETFSKYLWAFQLGLIGKDFGDNKRWFIRHVWSSPSFRLLQSMWFTAACLVIMYTYQGAIISAFAADRLKPRVSNIEELLKESKLGISTFKNSYPMAFFKRLVNTCYESLLHRMEHNMVGPPSKGDIPYWLDLIEEGKIVFIADPWWLKNVIGERFLKTGKCGLRMTNTEFGASYMSFAFRKELHNRSIFKSFNKGVRRFTEGSLHHRRMITSSLYYDICTGDSTAVVDPLNFSDLIGAFIIFGIGNGLACVIFALETFFEFKKNWR